MNVKIDDKNKALILNYALQAQAANNMLQLVVTAFKNARGLEGEYELSQDGSELVEKNGNGNKG